MSESQATTEPQEIVETRGDERVDLIRADTNNDGKVDLWVADTDGDGKADLFQFDTTGDGTVDITMVDLDEDGTPDEVVDGDGGHPPTRHRRPSRSDRRVTGFRPQVTGFRFQRKGPCPTRSCAGRGLFRVRVRLGQSGPTPLRRLRRRPDGVRRDGRGQPHPVVAAIELVPPGGQLRRVDDQHRHRPAPAPTDRHRRRHVDR